MSKAEYLKNCIKTTGINVIYFDTCNSTNTVLKELAEQDSPEGTIVIASGQTAGRGRLGRSFYSPDSCGLYLSILLRPKIKPEDALEITTAAGVSTARVIKRYTSGEVGIKWVNDIYVNMKKVCGILTESSFDVTSSRLKYAILGIGVNLFTPREGYPDEIADIADSIFRTPPEETLKFKIAGEIIDEFFKVYPQIANRTLIDEYRQYSVIIGKEVDLLMQSKSTAATVLGIDDDYSLRVKCRDGKILKVNSGDVSIKIKRK